MSKTVYHIKDEVTVKYLGKNKHGIIVDKQTKCEPDAKSYCTDFTKQHTHFDIQIDRKYVPFKEWIEYKKLSNYESLKSLKSFEQFINIIFPNILNIKNNDNNNENENNKNKEIFDIDKVIIEKFKIKKTGHKRKLKNGLNELQIFDNKLFIIINTCIDNIIVRTKNAVKKGSLVTTPIYDKDNYNFGRGGYKTIYEEAGYLPPAKWTKGPNKEYKNKENTNNIISKKRKHSSKQSSKHSSQASSAKSSKKNTPQITPIDNNISDDVFDLGIIDDEKEIKNNDEIEENIENININNDDNEDLPESKNDSKPQTPATPQSDQEPERKSVVIVRRTSKKKREGKIDADNFMKETLNNAQKKLQVKLNISRKNSSRDKKLALKYVKTPTELVVNGKRISSKKLKKRHSLIIDEALQAKDGVNVKKYINESIIEQDDEEEEIVKIIDNIGK